VLTTEALACGALESASGNRLACQFRHWTWANESMAQFERELAGVPTRNSVRTASIEVTRALR